MKDEFENIYIISVRTGLRYRFGPRDAITINSERGYEDAGRQFLTDGPKKISISGTLRGHVDTLLERLYALRGMAGDVHLEGCGFDKGPTYSMSRSVGWGWTGGDDPADHTLEVRAHFTNPNIKIIYMRDQWGQLIDLSEKIPVPMWP